MKYYIDACYESLNKENEELCGDKVEILRTKDSVIVVLADGLGSGVKANILATLTSKIIATMLSNGASIEEAVDTIANTLPICNERGIAYSTFSILKIDINGNCYLAEFDNPKMILLKKGKYSEIERTKRIINNKMIEEAHFKTDYNDIYVLISDGVMHAGIGNTLNLGWQWNNIVEYLKSTVKKETSAKSISKLLSSVCNNLYGGKPGDDTTVAVIKIRKPERVNVMVGPPSDKETDEKIASKFMSMPGKKVVCGGTTSQILSRFLGKEIKTSFDYFNPAIPPTGEIEGLDLVTEGILTIGKTVEYAKKYTSVQSTMKDFIDLEKPDGASRLAKILLIDSTEVHFEVGRAINPAHQNPEMPVTFGIKLKLINELAEYLTELGKVVTINYN